MPRLAATVAGVVLVLVAVALSGPSGAQDVDDRVVVTELAVVPDGSSVRGEPVTITVRGHVGADGSTGEVEGTVQVFAVHRGVRTTVATVPMSNGTAEVVTTSLRPGRHSFTARLVPVPGLTPGRSQGAVHRVVPAGCSSPGEGRPGAVVHRVYLDLLQRCPERAGFDHWVQQLRDGTSPEVFARSIAGTAEAVGWVVDDAYRTMLGRPADGPGRAFWIVELQRHGRYDRLLADLGGSDEFWGLAGSTLEGFVTRVYARILDRPPDRRGLDYWMDRSGSGSTRDLVLVLANADEPLARLVALAYDEILERAPSAAELAGTVPALRATGDRSQLYAQLIGSPEFADRAGGVGH